MTRCFIFACLFFLRVFVHAEDPFYFKNGERIVFLGQQISDDIANQIIGVMLYLDSEVRSSHPPRCVRLVALRAEACAC